MERILAPSILSADFNHLKEDISETARAGATYVHIDVMDGLFVPSISIGVPVVKSIRKEIDLTFDVHLMIEEPVRYVNAFAEAGADIITFHLEAASDIKETIDAIHKAGKKAGLTIKPKTPVESLRPYIDKVEMILIMTVEPGFGGQAYLTDCTKKISDTRAMIEESGRDTDLEVDGGVKLDNLHVVLDAGANVIVAGSAIYGGDVYDNTRAFLDRMK